MIIDTKNHDHRCKGGGQDHELVVHPKSRSMI